MTATCLPAARHSCAPEQKNALAVIDRPRTWATLAEAVRGNVLARRMMPMSYMELILTSNCNLRCGYCFEKDKHKQAVDMPEEIAYRAIDFLFEVSRDTKDVGILLFGGEPMLRFDLIQKVHRYVTDKVASGGKRVNWSMTTNGTLIDEERAEWLGRHGINYLLSMDGGRQDHDRYRRFPNGQGTFDLIMRRLPMMKRYQAWMGVKMSLVPEALPTVCQGIRELNDAGVNQFIVGYAHGIPWSDDDLIQYEFAMMELCELSLEMKYYKRHFRNAALEEKTLKERLEEQLFGCGAGRGRFCVDPCGDIYGCSKFATMFGPRQGLMPLGNVYQGFTKIENRQVLLSTGLGPRHKCGKCELRRECSGGCVPVSFFETGDAFSCSDVACKLTFIGRRVDNYMRRRHDEVFGTNWQDQSRARACELENVVTIRS